jgi:DNA repair exonuclease SbcCD ATPase subunit
MYIDRLSIQNFKAIKEADLEFSRINVFTGNNGHGKSSIVTALQFLITNELTSKMEDFVHWDANKFTLAMTGSHAGKKLEYLVQNNRSLTERQLLIDDSELVKQSDAVAWIRDHITDPVLARYSAVSMQHEATAILREKPAPQLGKLKQILGVNQVDSVAEEIKQNAKEIGREIDTLATEIRTLSEREYSYLDEFDVPDVSELETRKAEILEKKKKHEELMEVYRAQEKEYLLWSSKMAELEIEVDRLPKVDESIQAPERDWTRADSQELKRLQQAIDDLQEKIQKAKLLQSEHKHYNSQVQAKEKELVRAQEELEKFEAGTCPTCGQELHDDTLFGKIERKVTRAQEALQEQKALKPEEPGDIDQFIHSKGVFKGEKKALEDLKQQIDDYAETARVKEAQEALNQRIHDLEKEQPQDPELFNPGPFTLDGELKEIEADLARNEQMVQELERIQAHNQKIKTEKRANQKKIEEKEKEKFEKESFVKTYTKASSLLSKDFVSYLITSGTSRIETRMNAFFQKTYGGKYSVSLEQNKKSVDFSYSTLEKDHKVPVVMAAGFEQALLSVAFRLALCSRQPLGLMVLDEIDSDASDESSLSLFQALLEEPGFNQFFIVTHNRRTLEYLETEPGVKIFRLQDGMVSV